MKLIEQAEKHTELLKKQLARAEKEAAVLRQLAEIWPDMEVDKAHAHSAWAKAAIELTVDTRTEAIAFMRQLDLEPVGMKRDGCLTIKPLDQIDNPDREVGEVVWDYDPRPINKPKATLRAWAKSPMGTIEFRVHIRNDPAHTRPSHRRGARNRIVQHCWTIYDAPYGELISWSTSHAPGVEGRKTMLLHPESDPGAGTYEEQLYCENGNI